MPTNARRWLQLVTHQFLQTRQVSAGVDTEGCRFLTEDLMAEVVVMLGDKVQYKFDSGHVELVFDIGKMPLLTRQALGLADVLSVVVEVILDSQALEQDQYHGLTSATSSTIFHQLSLSHKTYQSLALQNHLCPTLLSTIRRLLLAMKR